MTLHPVIIAIPLESTPRSPRQVEVQREYARLALRHSARLSGAPLEGWRKNDREVPQPNEGFHWSVTHKREYAAAVVSDAPVGIDIERIEPRKRELHDSLAGEDEWAIMGDRSWSSFFRLWTAKEAILKAGGVGIADLLRCRLQSIETPSNMTFRYSDAKWQTAHYFHQEHVIAVTSVSNKIEWHVLPAKN